MESILWLRSANTRYAIMLLMIYHAQSPRDWGMVLVGIFYFYQGLLTRLLMAHKICVTGCEILILQLCQPGTAVTKSTHFILTMCLYSLN